MTQNCPVTPSEPSLPLTGESPKRDSSTGSGVSGLRLFKHQIQGVDFLIKGNRALFWEMGTGKTITAIAAFCGLRVKNPGLRLLVVAPLSLLNAAWAKDAAAYAPNLIVHNFHDDKDIPALYDILVVNFEALISPKNMGILLTEVAKGPFCIVVDESSRMKNHKSKTTKALLSLSPKFKHRIIMSGTPAPNSEMEYWAQAEFLKPGIFGGNFFKFRNIYFHLSRGNQVMQGQFMTRHQAAQIFSKGWKYSITASKRQELMALIAPLCSRLQKADCLDLPEQIDEVREVEMTANQKRIYKEMRTTLIAEIKGKTIAAMAALTKLMKLRELSSGFAYDERGEAHAIPGPNPKLNELLDVIEEAGDQQVIVWANFTWEIREIVSALSKIAPTRALSSETKDRDQVINDFIGGSVKYLVAHPRSAAHGLTFVNCSMQIFFSLDYSWESHEQARARTHRAGQKKNCTYVYLIAKGTIDEDILATLRRKGDAQEILWGLK